MTHLPPTPPPKRPSVHLDWRDWLPHLEKIDATEAEKRQFIEALWNIMMAFVDLGWDVDTRKNPSAESFDLTDVLRRAVIHSNHSNKQETV